MNCLDPWVLKFIYNDGTIVPCCYGKGPHFGNAFAPDAAPEAIDAKIEQFRRDFAQRIADPACAQCYKSKCCPDILEAGMLRL